MDSEIDQEIYLKKSYSEQMAWIGEEVENIINHNRVTTIREHGKDSYGMIGSTYSIKRLFEIIKADPKNVEHLNEVNTVEKELIGFFYDDIQHMSEEDIYKYWHSYLERYIEELNANK